MNQAGVAVKADAVASAETAYDVVVVGAGFAGMYMLHKLRGMGASARVFEAGTGVGGTWYWNRYPGARVDIESQEYSYSFSEELETEWKWTERYASQPELLRYANHVADRFDLKRDIQFETRVTSATFDESSNRWTVTTSRGDVVSAKHVVMATGCLSVPKEIDVPGAANFTGPTYHTSRWPKEGVDFTDKTVAVIGTGSSAIQSIPRIAQQAAHVTVFQRTPNFSLPAHNGPLDPDLFQRWLADREANRKAQKQSSFGSIATAPADKRADELSQDEHREIFERNWAQGGFAMVGSFLDTLLDQAANNAVADFVREKIRGVVHDPAIAEKLAPKGYPIGTKRPCVDTGYYETYNRENVTLVDLKETPIETLTPTGVKTSEKDFTVDCIVYALGFDAMTGAMNAIDIKGRGGESLREKWAAGPRTYLGLSIAGFPNMFLVTGPGSPSVLANMIVAIEQHVDWIADCIAYLGDRQIGAFEATEQAENDWVAHVNTIADATLFPHANSWYLGANVPGKPRVFMPYIGGLPAYQAKLEDVAAKDYEGYALG